MALCKFCGVIFSWGSDGDKWIPLVPSDADHTGLTREYQDENGELRAGHRQICPIGQGGPTVRVSRLARPVLAHELHEQPGADHEPSSGSESQSSVGPSGPGDVDLGVPSGAPGVGAPDAGGAPKRRSRRRSTAG